MPAPIDGDQSIIATWADRGFSLLLWNDTQRQTVRGAIALRREPIVAIDLPPGTSHDRAREALSGLLPFASRAVTSPFVDRVPIVDVVLVLDRGRGDEPDRIREPFQLGYDLEITPVSAEHARWVLLACEAPGYNRLPATDNRMPLYAFQRRNPPREQLHRWDPDERLQLCLALSRLVKPTTVSLAYSARLLGNIASPSVSIYPGSGGGLGEHAYVSDPNDDSLRVSDLTHLRSLVMAFFADPPDPKSNPMRAFWLHEYACRTRELQVRIPLVATALETLLSSSADAGYHLRKRLPPLQESLGGPDLTDGDVKRFWGVRSSLVHGSRHGGLRDRDFDLVTRIEESLRRILRNVVLNRDLFDDLATRERLDAFLPVEKRTRLCDRCRSEM